MFSTEEILTQIYYGNRIEQYLWFAGILLFGLLFLRLFSKTLSRLFFKLFKKFAKEIKGEKFVELLIKPTEFLLLISIVFWALNQLSFPLNEVVLKRKTAVVTYLDIVDKVYLFLVLFSFIWMLLRIIDFMSLVFSYRASLTESKSDDQLVPFIKELAKIIAIIIGCFVVLGMVFEINVLTLIAGLGIGGIAVALAAKDSLENLFGSFTIFLDKPFVVGDLVRVDGIEGNVEKVGFRSTQIRSTDKSIITVPNKKMIDSALENLTLRNIRRVKFTVGINYSTSPEVMKTIVREVNEVINQNEYTNNDGVVVFEEFGEYSLKLMVLYFIEVLEYVEYLKIKEAINYEISEIIQKNGSSFAFPTRTIIHIQEPGKDIRDSYAE